LLHDLRLFNKSVPLSLNCGYSTGGLWMKGALVGKVYSCFCDYQALHLSHCWCSLMEYLCRMAPRVEARYINKASMSLFLHARSASVPNVLYVCLGSVHLRLTRQLHSPWYGLCPDWVQVCAQAWSVGACTDSIRFVAVAWMPSPA
jgi:hypothetical protein